MIYKDARNVQGQQNTIFYCNVNFPEAQLMDG